MKHQKSNINAYRDLPKASMYLKRNSSTPTIYEYAYTLLDTERVTSLQNGTFVHKNNPTIPMDEEIAFLNLLLVILSNSLSSPGLTISVPSKYIVLCNLLFEIKPQELLPTYFTNPLSKVKLELYTRMIKSTNYAKIIFTISSGSIDHPLRKQVHSDSLSQSNEIDISFGKETELF